MVSRKRLALWKKLTLSADGHYNAAEMMATEGTRTAKAAVRLTYLSRRPDNAGMKAKPVRTSIDLPRELHRRLHEAAARKGCSARQLILASIERAVEDATPIRPRRRLSLDPPIVPAAKRKPFDLNDEQIYQLIEFP